MPVFQSLLISSLAILVASYLSTLTLLSAQAQVQPGCNPNLDSRVTLYWISKENPANLGSLTLHFTEYNSSDLWMAVITHPFSLASPGERD